MIVNTRRGPKKNTLIKQFLKDVDWGNLDYLVIDTPPGLITKCRYKLYSNWKIFYFKIGTSDEHLSVAQYLKTTGIDGALIVTTPQQVSLIDVRKGIILLTIIK